MAGRLHLDAGPWGELPRVNVSLKITSLYSQIDPMDFDGSRAALLAALRPLFRRRRRARVRSSTSTSSSSATGT